MASESRAQGFRQLRRRLLDAGFSERHGKGDHFVYTHLAGARVVVAGHGLDPRDVRNRAKDVERALAAVARASA